MQDPLTFVVMAAGVGSRFERGKPGAVKQVEPVGPGRATILDYNVFDAVRAGFERVVFVIRPDMQESFARALGDPIARRAEVRYAHQTLAASVRGRTVPAGRTKPWGTAHAALVAWPHTPGACAVVNADDFYGRASIETLALALRREGDLHHLVAYPLRDTLSEAGGVSRGLVLADAAVRYRDSSGNDRTAADDALASMNLWGFSPAVFDLLRTAFDRFIADLTNERADAELGLPSVVERGVREGACRVRVHRASDRWLGLTHYADVEPLRARIAALHRAGEYPDRLWR